MARFPTQDVAAALSDAARAERVPLSLLFAIAFAESSFDPSKTGQPTTLGERAQGLMQLMPKVQQQYGVTDPFDPKQSALGAAKLLAWLARARAINWDMGKMAAAYHWGATAFAQALAAGKPVPAEVQRYVKRVLAAQLFYRQQAPRTSSILVEALNGAIRQLAEDNPLYTPATELAAQWAPVFAQRAQLPDAQAVSDPVIHTWWQAYKTVYQRAPLDLGATDPSFVEPKFWLKVAKTVDAAEAAASKAWERVKDAGERAAIGIGGGLFAVLLLVFLANRRDR